MYSLEQRTDAIQLFIESGLDENAVIRSLGYPSPTMTIDCLDRDTIRRYRQRMDNLRPGLRQLRHGRFLACFCPMQRDLRSQKRGGQR